MPPLLRDRRAGRQPLAQALLTALLVTGGVRAAAPVAMELGESVGPTAAVSWAVSDRFSLGGRAVVGLVEEFDTAWEVSHTELMALATAQLSHEIPPGTLFAGVALGPAWVIEDRTRHQSERLRGSGVPLSADASALVAHGSLNAGIRLHLWQGFGVSVTAGPTGDWGADVGRVGWAGALELSWAR